MTEEDAKNWVKDKTNQNLIVSKFFEDHEPSKIKLAFFMAGIPGSGKTEFAENTIKEGSPELISIEHDKLVEYIKGYQPQDYYKFRKAGSILVSRILKECLSNGYGFIFDGTLSHSKGIKNIQKTIGEGYKVVIIYIVQDATKAWSLTKDRELLKKRAIEKKGFLNTCKIINANLNHIFRLFKENENFNFWIIDKNVDPTTNKATSIIYNEKEIGTAMEIEKALEFSYNIENIT